ncbi:hypothetical protein GAY30_27340 [Azospirillum brasilense]|uniref:hypothetical protein n=1 Tax=Azospirillum brasilense TaxID=192 RepID=UPI00157AFC29|nr:hypothetical protein [Azospirillum brasilense]NUB28542.1 hypothetical protein [Azospirillum brasilense]NUB35515.1 hypothetical protein [Azospirillum brasilense]
MRDRMRDLGASSRLSHNSISQIGFGLTHTSLQILAAVRISPCGSSGEKVNVDDLLTSITHYCAVMADRTRAMTLLPLWRQSLKKTPMQEG